MFSQACVKNSVHGGGGVYTLLGRHFPLPGHTPPLETHPLDTHTPWTPNRPPSPDGHCSGRYTSCNMASPVADPEKLRIRISFTISYVVSTVSEGFLRPIPQNVIIYKSKLDAAEKPAGTKNDN